MMLVGDGLERKHRLNLVAIAPINLFIKIINNKIYNVNKDCINLSLLNLKQCEIAKNDILKNNGSGIRLIDVRGENNDPNKVLVRNN